MESVWVLATPSFRLQGSILKCYLDTTKKGNAEVGNLAKPLRAGRKPISLLLWLLTLE